EDRTLRKLEAEHAGSRRGPCATERRKREHHRALEPVVCSGHYPSNDTRPGPRPLSACAAATTLPGPEFPMRPTTVAFPSALALPLAAQNQGIQLANGVDGGVDLAFDPLFVPPTGITVEAWITYDDSTIPTGTFRWPTIARQNISNASEVWLFRVAASNTASRSLTFAVRTPGGATNAVSYAFVAGEFAQFTHVAATYDGQTLSICKNGVQVATRTLTTVQEIPNNGGNTRIGNG